MTVVLFRVDDRLVHGQVTAGWGRVLSPEKIVIISDSIASSSWESELYRTAVPEGVDFEVLTVDELVERYASFDQSSEKVVILVEDLETVARCVESGLRIERINVGGIHYDEGKEEVLPYVYLDEDDRERLFELRERGISCSAQDVPSGKEVDIFFHLEKNEGQR
jgi:mannose/fructose/N-acetylgalactosamine-specific phosphotransferase system component IIB